MKCDLKEGLGTDGTVESGIPWGRLRVRVSSVVTVFSVFFFV